MDELLPLGSVVKDKHDKLYIITGYFPFGGPDLSGYYDTGDYVVIAFPCSMRIDYDYKKIRDVRKALKKYEWFDDDSTTIRKANIKEVVFEGYKDEAYYKLMETLKK